MCPPAGSACLPTEQTMIVGPIYFSNRQSFKRLLLTGIALLGGVLVSVFFAASTAAEEQHTSGSSNKSFRKQTVSSLPLGELTPQTRDKINSVVQKPSVYRRLPVTSISADPDHFRFLVRHPEVVVGIWELMGVTQMKTDRTGPYTIASNDGAGTISSVELVYGTDNLHIFYGTGTYEGPILKRKLKGKCVLVLRCENQIGKDGKATQTSQLDVFLKIDNATAGLIAKTIQPLVGTTADHNFVESLKFIQRLDQTTQKNGPGVERMSKRLDIQPSVQQKYAQVIEQVFQRAIDGSVPGVTSVTNIHPASAPTRRQQTTQPARALDPSKFANPNYPRQTSETSFQSYSQTRPAGSYSNGDASPNPYRPSVQPTTGPAIQVGEGNRLPAHGSQPPTYNSPTQSSYPAYRYQTRPASSASPVSSAPFAPTGQVRRQAYSEFQTPYGQPYNAAHAYRQFSGSGQGPVQATYDQYGNQPASDPYRR